MRCHFNQTTTNFLALNWLTCVSPQTGFRPQDGKRKETNKQTKKPTNKQTKGSRGWKRRASIMLLLRHIQPRLLSFSYSPSKSSTLKKFIFSHLSYFYFQPAWIWNSFDAYLVLEKTKAAEFVCCLLRPLNFTALSYYNLLLGFVTCIYGVLFLIWIYNISIM